MEALTGYLSYFGALLARPPLLVLYLLSGLVFRGARQVNRWSDLPLKTFERDIEDPRSRYHRLFNGALPERVALSADRGRGHGVEV
jgi:hypothetical protein